MIFSEKWGKDVDEAIELALKDLRLTKDEVEITILEEPTKGFLGLGSKLAKVRVEKVEGKKNIDIEDAEIEYSMVEDLRIEDINTEDKEIDASYGAEKIEVEGKYESRPTNRDYEKTDSQWKKARNGGEIEDRRRTFISDIKKNEMEKTEDHVGLSFLRETSEKMGISLDFRGYLDEDLLFVEISGSDAGTIIGKRGQTLDAIQYLTSLVVNKGQEKYSRVVLDAENYRFKREKTLENLAKRLAEKAVRTRNSIRLEPMNPYERMVIHATLQGDDRVNTASEGEDPYRRVVIELN